LLQLLSSVCSHPAFWPPHLWEILLASQPFCRSVARTSQRCWRSTDSPLRGWGRSRDSSMLERNPCPSQCPPPHPGPRCLPRPTAFPPCLGSPRESVRGTLPGDMGCGWLENAIAVRVLPFMETLSRLSASWQALRFSNTPKAAAPQEEKASRADASTT